VTEARGCPVCGSSDLKLYLDGSRHSLDHSAFGSSRTDLSVGRILRCANCSLGFSQTRPSDEQLKNLYGRLDAAVYESETAGRLRTAQLHLKILKRYASRPGQLLDIGCASGGFAAACVDAGWNVTGLEPSEGLSGQAKQLLKDRARILTATLQEADLAPLSFDAVTMWDVLEHVPDPVSFFRKGASLLKPGGLLLVNVPNLDSIPARVLRHRWPLLLPEHLNYFNPQSLRACARLSGVELLSLGRRPANFSVKYILYRVSQHVPFLSGMSRLLAQSAVANCVVPVWMGELYAVWKLSK
jgi:SAM-dependent methyltransferase